ncbi:hypothetical protein AAHC03_019275 [Spirometra sp. Aus1]
MSATYGKWARMSIAEQGGCGRTYDKKTAESTVTTICPPPTRFCATNWQEEWMRFEVEQGGREPRLLVGASSNGNMSGADKGGKLARGSDL